MRPYAACLPFVKCETCVIRARLRFGACALNISGLTLSLPTLIKLSKHLTLAHLPSLLCPNHPDTIIACHPWALRHSRPQPQSMPPSSTVALDHVVTSIVAPEHVALTPPPDHAAFIDVKLAPPMVACHRPWPQARATHGSTPPSLTSSPCHPWEHTIVVDLKPMPSRSLSPWCAPSLSVSMNWCLWMGRVRVRVSLWFVYMIS
jgi:hypothetical protein